MLTDLDGKVALVTGAASGIGRGLAEALAAQGMRLVIADIDAETLGDTAAALQSRSVPHLSSSLDIRDRDAWTSLVARAERELGPVQLLCNIAGVTALPTPMLDLDPEAWDWVVSINLTGPYNGAFAVGRRLRALRLPGHIVNTASTQGLVVAPNFAPYSAAKFGVVGFSEAIKMEFLKYDIGVSVLCPGPTRGNLMNSSRKIAPHLIPPGKTRPVEGYTHFQTPAEVAAKTVDAILQNRFYIITHPEYRPFLEARWEALDSSVARDADPAAIENIRAQERTALETYRAIASEERKRDPRGGR